MVGPNRDSGGPGPRGEGPAVQWRDDVPWATPGEVGRKIRQALNMAINRQELQDTLFFGERQFMMQPFFHETRGDWDPSLIPFFEENYRYDPVRAKELLTEAGYPDGFMVQVILTPRGGLANVLDVNEAIAGYWRAIGLEVDTPSIGFAQVIPIVTSSQSNWF